MFEGHKSGDKLSTEEVYEGVTVDVYFTNGTYLLRMEIETIIEEDGGTRSFKF